MIQYKKRHELKNRAKDTLEGKYGSTISILLLNFIISWMVRFSVDIIGSNTANSIYVKTGSETAAQITAFLFNLLLLLATVILGVMNAGITLYFLKLACGQPFSLKDLFYGYRTDSGKILVITAAMVLCEAICLSPCQYFAQNYLNSWDGKWLIFSLIALAIGLCIYIPVYLGIALSFYLMFDFPQKTGKEVLRLCWHLMKGKRLRLFCLDLSFLPLMLLCVLSFGIGFLWLQPYIQMTYTFFFLDMMNPRTASE